MVSFLKKWTALTPWELTEDAPRTASTAEYAIPASNTGLLLSGRWRVTAGTSFFDAK